MTLDKYFVYFFIAEVCWTLLFCVLLYRREFTSSLAWDLFISHLVWKGSYVCQKGEFFILQKNKQALPIFKK